MKSIILTYAPVTETERRILTDTNIFKLAVNQHAEDLKPDARIITDYILKIICEHFPHKIISVRDKFRYESPRVEYFKTEFKGATIVAALEYLIFKNYNEILILGDNSVNTDEFQNLVKYEIDKIKEKAKVYQYKNGNFNLPVMSVNEFCKDSCV